ncbi:MAG: flagellar protein FlgN [Candidatus Scalindua sp.]|nr:flagellar protein FlgN [Candidatus Scalindua sp.]MBT6564862.1 flagellar protein FlgN [Candidatus Scalindua sp.]MBT7592979.1 flagellar protein FlgN [Candidatus Scalindua sp.]
MENLLNNLSETLDKMVITYKDILQTAQEKKEHIISGDIDKLESIIYQERNLAESILLLEEKRRYILNSINQSLGNNSNSAKLSELIEQIREPYKSKLREQYDVILEIITKVEEINKVNTSLTKYSLEYINNLIRSICSESLNDSTYQQSGKFNEPELKRMLLEIDA